MNYKIVITDNTGNASQVWKASSLKGALSEVSRIVEQERDELTSLGRFITRVEIVHVEH